MKRVAGSLLLITLLFSFEIYGQNISKIEKKFSKLYEKQKIEKLTKIALKTKKKYPNIEISYYYLSLIELQKYSYITSLPNKKQWNHLRKASAYSKKLGSNYGIWKDSIKHYYNIYIRSWNDTNYKSAHLKKVVKTYSSHHKDTLPVYYKYFESIEKTIAQKEYNIPKTDSLRTALIKFASELVGIPYKWAGETPEAGFDCSGFVKYVYQHIGIDLPHSAQMQSNLDGDIYTLKEAKPGDLIFFGRKNGNSWSTQHAGIVYEYTENEPKVIHCVSRGVSIDGNNSSWDHYWKERILFVKRLPELKNK